MRRFEPARRLHLTSPIPDRVPGGRTAGIDLAPDIPWAKMIGMRHILVHDCFGIDTDVVLDVVEHDLPDLKRNVKALLSSLG